MGKLRATPNYTGIERPDRFAVGYLGEFAVSEYLFDSGVKHVHRIHLDGHSQRSEFLVGEREGGPTLELEVKTAAQERYKNFMFPAAQKIDADIFVGARIESPMICAVALWGWLPRSEVEALPIDDFGHGPTRHCLLADMLDLAELPV